ncbi:MAG TPA: AAA family ATPase [Nitrospira sp.]|nr:AAA family ATPase [Nitrospira sp.]
MSADVSLAVPPHNFDAEQAVLGAILLDGSILNTLAGSLDPEHFYKTSHGTIYQAMLELAAGGRGIDNITLAAHLSERGVLGTIGGAVYLAELVTAVSGTANFKHHASIIVQNAQKRMIRTQALKVCAEINDGADLDRIISLLPDAATLQRDTPESVTPLAVVTAASLLETEEVDSAVEWTLYQLIACGALIGLIAKPKVGKTTLIYELAVKIAHGAPFLGRATRKCGVLILALEEHRRDVSRRLRTLGAENLENMHLAIGPLDADEVTFAQLKRTIEERSIGLIIIDTLNSFWGVSDENNASEVTAAIKPLLNLARSTNAAIIAIHHSRKSEGEHGDEIRGSNALFSLFDAALLLKRHEAENQRKLTVISRWPETPSELILELRDHGYECLGDGAAAGRRARLDKLAEALTSEGQTAKDLSSRSGVSFRSVHSILDELVQLGRAQRLGTGRKGDAFKFIACL